MYSSRSLLGHFHEPPQIGSCRGALDEQMRVIGHDAIGKNCEFLESRSTPELLERPSHDVAIDKDLLPKWDPKRANLALDIGKIIASDPDFLKLIEIDIDRYRRSNPARVH